MGASIDDTRIRDIAILSQAAVGNRKRQYDKIYSYTVFFT